MSKICVQLSTMFFLAVASAETDIDPSVNATMATMDLFATGRVGTVSESASKLCLDEQIAQCEVDPNGKKTIAECRKDAADAFQLYQHGKYTGCVSKNNGVIVASSALYVRYYQKYFDFQNNGENNGEYTYQDVVDNLANDFSEYSFCTHDQRITKNYQEEEKPVTAWFHDTSLVCAECESICNQGFDTCIKDVNSKFKNSSVQEQNQALDACGNTLMECVEEKFGEQNFRVLSEMRILAKIKVVILDLVG